MKGRVAAAIAICIIFIIVVAFFLSIVHTTRRHHKVVRRVVTSPPQSRQNSSNQTVEFDRAMEEGTLSALTLASANTIAAPPPVHIGSNSRASASSDTLPVYEEYRLPKFQPKMGETSAAASEEELPSLPPRAQS